MFLKKFLKNDLKEEQEAIEKEFEKGNIVLPTGKRDYEDWEDFKEKTSHLEDIQKQLKFIEEKGTVENGE